MRGETIRDRLEGRRVGMAFSSGYFGFFHHAGVLSSLYEAGVRPVRVTGNSAGALVGGLFASGLPPAEIATVLLALKRRDFWDVHFPLSVRGASLLAGRRFRALLGRALAAHSFEACPIPLAVGAYDLDTGRMVYLDSGSVIQAVYASAALPYLFAPEHIDGRRLWDGGFAEKTPLVPFLGHDDVDVIVVSYLPPRGRRPHDAGARRFLPPLSALFADIPYEERMGRDKASLAAVEAAGMEVLFLMPETLRLGPFSLHKADIALRKAAAATTSLLQDPVTAVRPWRTASVQK